MVVGILGGLKAGAAYVRLDLGYPAERLSYQIKDSACAMLLTQTALRERLAQLSAASEADSVLPIIDLDGQWSEIARQPAANPDVDSLGSGPRQPAYVIYTSGSTGRPKAVIGEHRGLSNLVSAQIRLFGVQADSRVLQFASFSFDAFIFEALMALCRGAQLCLAERERLLPGPGLWELMRGQRITHVTLPPSALRLLPEEELPDLQTLVVAGEACPVDLARKWASR